jgi:hypothetical protein
MGYVIKHGAESNVQSERCETATACLEILNTLKAADEPNIKISDRTGAELSVADLQKLSDQENI